MPQFCSVCGAQLAEGAASCSSCGKSAAVSSGGAAAAPAPATASAGLDENVAGMLAYFTIIPAVLFLVLEPYNKNKFVRFHSFQSIFFTVALTALWIGISVVSAILSMVPMLGVVVLLAMPLIWLASFVAWVLLVVKAYKHEMYKLPFIGDLSEKQA